MWCNCQKRKWWYGSYEKDGTLHDRFNSIMAAKKSAQQINGTWRKLSAAEANA